MISSNQTTGKQKCGLLFGAMLMVFVLLEVILRLSGFFFLLTQDHPYRQPQGARQEFKILCLGESTTALGGEQAYPQQLERILNQRQNQIYFKVINKGVPATTTDQILARVPFYLNEVKPDLVIAMMGINDPFDWSQVSWAEQWSRYSKAFKLCYMIFQHWSVKKDEIARGVIDKEIRHWDQRVQKEPSISLMAELVKANLYRSANRLDEEFQSIQKAISMDPKNSQAWFLLGIYYERQAEHEKALDAFLKSNLQVSKEFRLNILGHIGQCQKFLNRRDEAIRTYQTILSLSPRHPEAFDVLGDIYFESNQISAAQKCYETQLAINPKKTEGYGKLAHCYRLLGDSKKSALILREGIKINPQDAGLWVEQGYAFMDEGAWAEAKSLFLKALERNNQNQHGANQKIYEKLSECAQHLGEQDQVEFWQQKAKAQSRQYNRMTKKNYEALIRELNQKQIPLLAMQYPRRSIAPLKDMLADSSGKGIVFVDSQDVFSQAVEQGSYDEYFSDRFAGDFGHCTAKGNTLLATRAADIVLKNYYP